MKIVFMGTPDFAVPCLRALAQSDNDVAAVFTQPDKPKGRGYKMIPTPVKKCAEEYNIPVYQPVSLRKGEDAEKSIKILKEINPELIIVVAYGQLLPKSVLELPENGCINIHASLLPKYRGAAPIQRCVLDGEKITGVTSMMMEEGLDTGDMLISDKTEIGADETASELHDRLSLMGAEVLVQTVDALKKGELIRKKQNDDEACYAKMITKDMSSLDFSKSAAEIHNVIRGITGFTVMNGKRLKIYRSTVSGEASGEPGTIDNEKDFTVVCGDGKCLKLLEVQYEGGKRMSTSDFLRGRKLEKGQKLG